MRVRLVTALLIAALAAGACNDDEPAAGPTLPPITETPSASPTAEAIPTEATAATPEGAQAFVRLWFDELNRAAGSGDTVTLQALSDPACATCTRFIDSITSLYEPGGRIEGGRFTVTAVEVQPLAAGGSETRALVVYDVTPTRQLGAAGQTLAETEALSQEAGDLVLARSGNGWRLREFA